MSTKHSFEFEAFNDNIKKSQKLILFSLGMMAGTAISCIITGILLYFIEV